MKKIINKCYSGLANHISDHRIITEYINNCNSKEVTIPFLELLTFGDYVYLNPSLVLVKGLSSVKTNLNILGFVRTDEILPIVKLYNKGIKGVKNKQTFVNRGFIDYFYSTLYHIELCVITPDKWETILLAERILKNTPLMYTDEREAKRFSLTYQTLIGHEKPKRSTVSNLKVFND